jgi:uncharacterized protein
MRIIDLHSHWGTKRGYPFQTPEELAQQRRVFRSDPSYVTEQEMVAHFREMNVSTLLDLGVRSIGLQELKSLHDYAFDVQQSAPDAVLGNWLHIDPRTKADGLKELERCLKKRPGIVGLAVAGAGFNVAASDPLYDPFYRVCMAAGAPVLIMVGYTGLGATLPGGGGVILDYSHPRFIDLVAARYAEMTIVASRPAWPWQSEMNAVLLHKANVWYEVHGWSPKYFAPELKHEISRRLRDRVMFGADYPLIRYERLIADWQSEGYGNDVLEKVFYQNAERFLDTLKT